VPTEELSLEVIILISIKNCMKLILVLVVLLSIMLSSPAYGHKLISHDDSHRSFDMALPIPDHEISWAIYENLGENEAKYYSFEAKKGDSFYASIVIPKIQGLEEYAPTIVLVDPRFIQEEIVDMDSQLATEKYQYEGEFPGKEFYEPFGQVTYWERQEIKTEIPADGKYYIIVMDERNQSGKYSLAVGTIEDFSGADFFTVLPKAWFDTKIFVNDYTSILIFFIVLSAIIAMPLFVIKKRKQKLIVT
jgi:hypothetical protein